GRDGRLARAGGAADEDDQRQVEVLQLAEAAQAADRARPVRLAEHLDGELLETLELDALLAPVGEVLLDALRQLVGPPGRTPDRNQRPRHQPPRVRLARPP